MGQLVLCDRDRARRLRHQVEVHAAQRLIDRPVWCVDDDGTIEHRVVEHEGRIVGDEHVRSNAEFLDRRMGSNVDDPTRTDTSDYGLRGIEVVGPHEDHEVRSELARQPLNV